VWTRGALLSDLDDAARRAFRVQHVGLVFQEFELLDYLDVLDNILLPYRVHPSMRLDGAVRDRAIALARDVGLGDKLRRHPQRLSHGEKQRAAVCRALVTQPDLLLADEPTGNLDPVNKERVLEILVDHARATGATLVTVTHDHGMLKRFGRVIDFHALASDSVEGASA
jgi:putative ABC transport system ATP-binding protein